MLARGQGKAPLPAVSETSRCHATRLCKNRSHAFDDQVKPLPSAALLGVGDVVRCEVSLKKLPPAGLRCASSCSANRRCKELDTSQSLSR